MNTDSPPFMLLIVGVAGIACASPREPVVRAATVGNTRDAATPSALGAREAEPSAQLPLVDAGGASVPEESAPAPATAPAVAAYSTPLLDADDLEKLARRTCEESKTNRRPVLIEFSADWCQDCLLLETQKARAPLKDELSKWELLPVNVGEDGFQHPELMRAFRVNAIAKLVALRPRDCALPLRLWRPLAMRTLSGVGSDGERLNTDVSQWLSAQRDSQR